MRAALEDPQLLGGALPGDSWRPWRILLIAAMGEELSLDERPVFETLTGREQEPGKPVEEFWGVIGRRAGKTRAAGALAAYIGCLCDHSENLAPGERGALPIIAASQDQAAKAYRDTTGILQLSPVLAQQVEGDPTSRTIRLRSNVDIEIRAANFRTIRGITAVGVICDEVAFWQAEGASNPDKAILDAIRPALGTTGGVLWVISSPHAKKGQLFETYRRHYGPGGDPLVLVARGATKLLNGSYPQHKIDREYERDAVVAATEYGAEFRSDLEAYVSREVVEACVIPGLKVRPPARSLLYKAFVDPSGGANDAMTLSVAHLERDRCIVDLLIERKPPFSPEAVVAEFVETLKAYGLSSVTGDRYAGEWPREAFRRRGIAYELAGETRSELYQGLLPLLNSGRIELLDDNRLVSQIAGLERRVARGGRESIDHAPGGHDDLANAVAGVAGLVVRRPPRPVALVGYYGVATPWDEPNPLVGSY